jgi:hypothetical protein
VPDSSPESRPSRTRHTLAVGIGIGLAVGAVVGMIVGTLLGSGVAVLVMKADGPQEQAANQQGADVEHPETLARAGYALEFPGNWRVASEEDDFDPDAYFSIDSPGGSYLTIEIVDEPLDVAEEVRLCVADYVPEWLPRPAKEPFTDWGAYEGLGLDLSGRTVHGERGGVRIFAHSGEGGGFVVVEVFYDDERAQAEPGFALIRKSFQLRNAPAAPESAKPL